MIFTYQGTAMTHDGNPSLDPTSSLPSNIICKMAPKRVPSSRLERHLQTSTPNIASFDHLAHYRSSNQRGSMKKVTSNIASFDHLTHYRSSYQRGSMEGPTKNTTQRHLARSIGTQQVSIGSTEVHIVAASNYHHTCW